MLNLAEKGSTLQPALEYGHLLEREGPVFLAGTSYGTLRAEKAASCLMEPCAGDTVLLVCGEAGGNFILAVLRREDAQTGADMIFEGPVRVSVKNGGFALSAHDDLSLASHRSLSLTSAAIGIHADTGEAKIGEVSLVSRLLKTHIEYVKSVAVTVDEIYQKLTQRLENCFRFIKDQEEVQSGSSRYLAEDLLTIHSKNSLIVAEEHVTINAEKIHLG